MSRAPSGAIVGDPVSEGRRVKLSFAETEKGDAWCSRGWESMRATSCKAAVALADDGRYLMLERVPGRGKA